MTGRGETEAALRGVRGILGLDPDALDAFDGTARGLARSFRAAVLVLPLYLPVVLTDAANSGALAAPVRWTVTEAAAYVMGWVAYPLIVLHLARFLECDDNRLFRYLVPYNWFRGAVVAAYAPVALLAAAGVLPAAGAAFLGLLVTAAVLMYKGWLARHGLAVPLPTAILLVAMDFLLHVLIDAVAARLA